MDRRGDLTSFAAQTQRKPAATSRSRRPNGAVSCQPWFESASQFVYGSWSIQVTAPNGASGVSPAAIVSRGSARGVIEWLATSPPAATIARASGATAGSSASPPTRAWVKNVFVIARPWGSRPAVPAAAGSELPQRTARSAAGSVRSAWSVITTAARAPDGQRSTMSGSGASSVRWIVASARTVVPAVRTTRLRSVRCSRAPQSIGGLGSAARQVT